jgi:15-cis-phytoene synthase
MIASDTAKLSPPQHLAAAYARKDLRAAWSLLLEFDNRIMAIALKGQEPVLKQMRLAWWREQLAKAVADRPKGEPLLARLSQVDNAGQVQTAMAKLIDAWEELIVDDGDAGVGLQKCADLRSDALFVTYAEWVGSDAAAATEAGRAWALASFSGSSPIPARMLPRQLKPLNLLVLANAVERSGGRFARLRAIFRLYLHALTGL